MGACPAVEGREPGWIRRRPARGPASAIFDTFYYHRFVPSVRILSTHTFRVAGVWILSTQTFGERGEGRILPKIVNLLKENASTSCRYVFEFLCGKMIGAARGIQWRNLKKN